MAIWARRLAWSLGCPGGRGGGGSVSLFHYKRGLLSARCFCNSTIPYQRDQKEEPESSSPPQRSSFPILVVPRPPDTGTGSEKVEKSNDDDYYHYFHLADFEEDNGYNYKEEEKPLYWPKVRRIEKNKIPGVPNYDLAQCVGSSHGWLAFTDHPNPNINSSISFVNPLSSEQKPNHFRLPPIPLESGGTGQKAQFSSPLVATNNQDLDQEQDGDGGVPFVQKVALSSPPCEDTCIIAAAIHGGPRHNLAFYIHKHEKVEATWWIPGGGGGGGVGDYSDVVYSKKDGIFYAIRNPQPNDKVTDYPIEAWDPCSRQFNLIHPSLDDPYPHELERPGYEGELDEKRYLVESSRAGGDLYLICRYIAKMVDEDGIFGSIKEAELDPNLVPCYRTLLFRAYKLNWIDMCWVLVDDWEREAFFVGRNHSFSFPYVEPHYPVIWPDNIYYSDDYFDKMHLSQSFGGHDNGVCWGYDTSPIYNDAIVKIQPPPIWLDDLSLP